MKKVIMMLAAVLFFSGCTLDWGGRRVFSVQPNGGSNNYCNGKGNIVFTAKGEHKKEVKFYRKNRSGSWVLVDFLDLGPASIEGRAFYDYYVGYNDILKRRYHEIWLNFPDNGRYKVVVAPYYQSMFERRRFYSNQSKNTYPFRPEYDEPPIPQTYHFTVNSNKRSKRLFDGCWIDEKIDNATEDNVFPR